MTGNAPRETEVDARLVAYLDGELDPAETGALEKDLAENAALKARLDELAGGGIASSRGFDLLLEAAPTERLKALLAGAEAESVGNTAPGRRRWLAAAAGVLLLVAGAGLGFGFSGLLRPSATAEHTTPPNWRAVVAEYVSLYTPETFAAIPSDPAIHAAGLKAVGDRLGLRLDPNAVALPDLELKGAILFRFRDMPLAQIAYLSPTHGPAEFCIIVNGRPDAAPDFEQREGKNIVYWTRNGRGYMVIGDLPRATLEAYAATLEGRLS